MTLLRYARAIMPAVLLATLCTAQPVLGQAVSDLAPGARISLWLGDSPRSFLAVPQSQYLVGQLVSSTADSVYVQLRGAPPFGVARTQIRRMAVSRGVSRTRSAVESGLTGLFAVAVVGSIEGRREGRGKSMAWAGAILGGAGVVLGALRPYETWHRLRD